MAISTRLECLAFLLLFTLLNFIFHTQGQHAAHESKVLRAFNGNSVRGIAQYGNLVIFALRDQIIFEKPSDAIGAFAVNETNKIKIDGYLVDDSRLLEFKVINESAALLCNSAGCSVCYRSETSEGCNNLDFPHSGITQAAASLVNDKIFIRAINGTNAAIYAFEPVGVYKYQVFKIATDVKLMTNNTVVTAFSTPAHTFFIGSSTRQDLALRSSFDDDKENRRFNREVRITRICNGDNTRTLDSRIDLVLSCDSISYLVGDANKRKEVFNEVTAASYFADSSRLLIAIQNRNGNDVICEYDFKKVQERFDDTWSSCQSASTATEKLNRCRNVAYDQLPQECFIFAFERNVMLPFCQAFNKLTDVLALDNCKLHESNSSAYRYGWLENFLPFNGKVVYQGSSKVFVALKESTDPQTIFAMDDRNKVQRLMLGDSEADNILMWRPARAGSHMLEVLKSSSQVIFIKPTDDSTVNNMHISCEGLYPTCADISWKDPLKCGFCANSDGSGRVMPDGKLLCPKGLLRNVCPPFIKFFKYTSGDYLIEGRDLDVLKDSYVTICDQKCNITTLQKEYIRCKVPKEREKSCNVTVVGHLGNDYPSFMLQKAMDDAQSASTEGSTSTNNHMKILRYIGFAVAFIFLIGLILFIYYRIHRYIKSRRNKETGKDTHENSTPIAPSYDPVPRSDIHLEDFGRFTIHASQLKIIKEIGHGFTATVYLGQFQPDLNSDRIIDVAVKTTRDNLDEADVRKEIEMMKAIRHENVVAFMGWATNGNNTMIVTEYMGGGSVQDYLRDPQQRPTIGRCFSYIHQLLEGMVYLSHKHVIHRDLATRNCLLNTTHDILKISDFGLSRQTNLDYEYVSSNNPRLPYRWLPLESLLNSKTFTSKGDVWSFGIVVWELFQRASIPYEGMDIHGVVAFLESDQRLGKPQYCPDALYDVMLNCWDREPEKRPSFDHLRMVIQQILSDVERENPAQVNTEYERPLNTRENYPSTSYETRTTRSGSSATTAV